MEGWCRRLVNYSNFILLNTIYTSFIGRRIGTILPTIVCHEINNNNNSTVEAFEISGGSHHANEGLGTVPKLFSKTVILNTRNKLKLEKLS